MSDTHIQEEVRMPAPPLDDGDREPPWRDLAKPAAQDDPGAMAVFVAWEKLRLVYNMILAAESMLLMGLGTLFWLPILLQGALLANVCFCAGPVAEGYLCLLGANRTAARWTVFILGILASVVLVWAAIAGQLGFPALWPLPDR